MPVLQEQERRALIDADHQLARLQAALDDAAQQGAFDDAHVDRWRGMARDVAARVDEELPLDIDPSAASEIRSRLVKMLTVEPSEQQRSLDVADRFLMQSEAIRHVLRDLLESSLPVQSQSSAELIAQIEAWLPSLAVRDLAELLGLSERSLQRRRGGDAASTSRMVVVAQLIAILRHAWTDEGVYAWFQRPRHELGGRAPIELLDDDGAQRDLVRAARGGRVQRAS